MKPKRIRKNRKIKFDEDQYIEKYYFHDDKVVIPLDLEKTSDLYMKHDHMQMELAYSVCDYIEEIAYMVPVNIDIRIEIHCPRVSKEEQEKMARSIKNNYGMEIDEVEYDIMILNRKSLILLLVGGLILAIYIYLEKFSKSTVLTELFCIFWWVAIWNVIEMQTLEKRDNKEKRLNYQQLYDAEITFVFDK